MATPKTQTSDAVELSAEEKTELDKLVSTQVDKIRVSKKNPFLNIEATVEHAGKHIVLPAEPQNMGYDQAIQWLNQLAEADKAPASIYETVNAFPLDGAVAFSRALKALFGFANPETAKAKSFFEVDKPPTMVSVDTGIDERITVFWGEFSVPGIKGRLNTSVTGNDDGRYVFCLSGTVTRGSLPVVHKLAELTRRFVRAASIYRGKAIELRVDDNGDINWKVPPRFIDLSGARPEELIFSTDVQEQITVNLFTPLEFTEVCRQTKIPLKRTVLMEGPFGTGKTLCANVAAQKAVANGWTFINIARASGLREALQMAALYQPAVVFCEDIDREVAGQRSVQMDDILNTIDGVLSKGKEILVVLTSNEAEKINRAMLRPGRIDAVIHIAAPDAEAAERLVRLYGRGLIAPDTPLPLAAKLLDGKIPAVIREAVERAKLYAIAREGHAQVWITDQDVAGAAKGMKRHLDLLKGKEENAETLEHKVGRSLVEALNYHLGNGEAGGLAHRVHGIEKMVKTVEEWVDNH